MAVTVKELLRKCDALGLELPKVHQSCASFVVTAGPGRQMQAAATDNAAGAERAPPAADGIGVVTSTSGTQQTEADGFGGVTSASGMQPTQENVEAR